MPQTLIKELKKKIKVPAPGEAPLFSITLQAPAVEIQTGKVEGHEQADMRGVAAALESFTQQLAGLTQGMAAQQKQQTELLQQLVKAASNPAEQKAPVVNIEASNNSLYLELDLDENGECRGMYVNPQAEETT